MRKEDLPLKKVKGISIGPVTSDAARNLGVPILAQAAEASLDALVQALLDQQPKKNRPL
jgi:uroporphyrinogen-III synthase